MFRLFPQSLQTDLKGTVAKCDFVKYELFKNALIDAIRDAIPKETFDDFSQRAEVALPILFTVLGNSIVSNALHNANAFVPILVTPSAMLTEQRFTQLENAAVSILVTSDEIVTLSIELHPANTAGFSNVHLLGITNSFTNLSSRYSSALFHSGFKKHSVFCLKKCRNNYNIHRLCFLHPRYFNPILHLLYCLPAHTCFPHIPELLSEEQLHLCFLQS